MLLIVAIKLKLKSFLPLQTKTWQVLIDIWHGLVNYSLIENINGVAFLCVM